MREFELIAANIRSKVEFKISSSIRRSGEIDFLSKFLHIEKFPLRIHREKVSLRKIRPSFQPPRCIRDWKIYFQRTKVQLPVLWSSLCSNSCL